MMTILPYAKFPGNLNPGELKAVWLDCYGTIIEAVTEDTPPEHLVWRVLSRYQAYYGFDYEPSELCEKFFRFHGDEKRKGKLLSAGEAFDIEERNVFRRLMPGAGEQLIQNAGEIFRASTTRLLRLYPGAKEFMEELRGAGVKLCLMSNAQTIYTVPELRGLGIYDLFDEVGISSDFFYRKPSPEFFRIMLSRLRLAASKVLMIGNHPGDDITTPHQMGIHTCYLNSNQSPPDAPPADSEMYDIFLDYPQDPDAPQEAYPFYRLREFFLGGR